MNLELVYGESVKLLKELSCKDGFLASGVNRDNYLRIWSRDGVVAGLASLMSGDKELVETFERHLLTLRKFQDRTGRIPSNVDIVNNKVSYGTLVGKVDATLWYVIGVAWYYRVTRDLGFLKRLWKSIERAVFYLEALELNGKGMLYVPTGGDWADEYITHGYVLFDQLLYLEALRGYGFISKVLKKSDSGALKKAGILKKMIGANYFSGTKDVEFLFNESLYNKIDSEFNEKYALASFSSDGFIGKLDSFSNSLLLVFDILGEDKNRGIIRSFLKRLSSQKVKILPAFWPVIKRGRDFKILKMNSLFKLKNRAHHFHNGGLWPLIQGFFIAGLVRQKRFKEAEYFLGKFSNVLEKDNFEFNEYYDSKRYKACGIPKLGFSAAGFMIGYLAVKRGKVVFS